MPKVPAPPPPPAQRQSMKLAESKAPRGDGAIRRRGYAALMMAPRGALQAAPTTTSTLGG